MKRAKQRTAKAMASLRFQWTAGPIMDSMFGAYVAAYADGPKAQFKAMAEVLTQDLTKMVAENLAKKLFGPDGSLMGSGGPSVPS